VIVVRTGVVTLVGWLVTPPVGTVVGRGWVTRVVITMTGGDDVGLGSSVTRVVTTPGPLDEGSWVRRVGVVLVDEVTGLGIVVTAVETTGAALLDGVDEGLFRP